MQWKLLVNNREVWTKKKIKRALRALLKCMPFFLINGREKRSLMVAMNVVVRITYSVSRKDRTVDVCMQNLKHA